MRRLMLIFDKILRIALTIFLLTLIIYLMVRDKSKGHVSRELEPSVESWQRDMTAAGLDWQEKYGLLRSVQLAELSGGSAGYSNYFAHTIEIASDLPKEGEYTLKTTVYHELGHSVFRLKHGSCSIMREEISSEEECRRNWPQWLEEYKAACKQSKS
jgi:hypothetical protein